MPTTCNAKNFFILTKLREFLLIAGRFCGYSIGGEKYYARWKTKTTIQHKQGQAGLVRFT
jgi:hypothetical protein